MKYLIAILLLISTMIVSGCVGLSTAVQQDAKHIEITSSGLIVPLSPDPAGAALVIGTRRISIDSVPVYTISAAEDTVTQFQSLYEEYDGVNISSRIVDTISFCNDTHLGADTSGTGGNSQTVARTSSGNAATDRCSLIPE